MFSEPPINIIDGVIEGASVSFADGHRLPAAASFGGLAAGAYRFGVRASHLSLERVSEHDVAMEMIVDLAEISGSETFLHVRNDHLSMTAHLTGVHHFEVDDPVTLYFSAQRAYAFDSQGAVRHIPAHLGGV